MRAAALLALTLTCATATGGSVDLKTIASGAFAQAQPAQRQAVAARDAETYERVWRNMVGSGEPPQVDFASQSVVFLFGGSKPTGGWMVEARGASLEGKTLVMDAEVKGPPPDAIVTQAFTSPYAVVTVSTKDFEDVRW